MPTRPCWAEIRTSALEANYRFLADIAAPHAELLAIVKANAYGHSLDVCAPAVMRAVDAGSASPASKKVSPLAHSVPKLACWSLEASLLDRAQPSFSTS